MPQDTVIKRELQRKGWSYRKAAPLLGVHWVYLCGLANGKYKSRRLGIKILNLPFASQTTSENHLQAK